MNAEQKAAYLVHYTRSLKDFQIVKTMYQPHAHMGATIADAMLSPGLRYETVIAPKVQQLRRRFPDAATTSGFLELLQRYGPRLVLDWDHPEKVRRIVAVATFLRDAGVESEEQLKAWLSEPANGERLKQVRGVADATVDYFKLLTGFQTSAMNLHQRRFLRRAKIKVADDDEAKRVISLAADLMGVERARFDYSIWKYMTAKSDASASA